MKVAYIRVSTDKQETDNQKAELVSYAVENMITFSQIIQVEMSSKKTLVQRRIDDLLELPKGSIIYATELSRIGRNMLEVCSIINQLDKAGINIVFTRQKELSVIQGEFSPTRNLLLAVYGFVAETERKWISERTRASLHIKRDNGVILGRPKGTIGYHKLEEEQKKLFDDFTKYKASNVCIGKALGVSTVTVKSWKKKLQEEKQKRIEEKKLKEEKDPIVLLNREIDKIKLQKDVLKENSDILQKNEIKTVNNIQVDTQKIEQDNGRNIAEKTGV